MLLEPPASVRSFSFLMAEYSSPCVSSPVDDKNLSYIHLENERSPLYNQSRSCCGGVDRKHVMKEVICSGRKRRRVRGAVVQLVSQEIK